MQSSVIEIRIKNYKIFFKNIVFVIICFLKLKEIYLL